MTRRVLVIDDERSFIPEFVQDGTVVRYARTARQAIDDLRWEPWDEVWWDHDLGVGGETKEILAWMFAKAFEQKEYGFNALPSVQQHVVHSLNFAPDGRDRIYKDLQAMYGYDKVRKVTPTDEGLVFTE